jgi:hypothetical protein
MKVESDTTLDEKALRHKMANSFLEDHFYSLSSDVGASKKYNVPLGLGDLAFLPFSDAVQPDRSIDRLALEVGLPILRGVDLKRLIKLRRDEKPHFDRFRVALRKAMRERLESSDQSDLPKVAREIVQDLLQPEIRRIENALRSANKLFLSKAGQTIVLGALSTVVGLFVGNPLLTAALVAAGLSPSATTLLNAAHRRSEQRQEVKLSNMYFVWKAQKHARPKKSPVTKSASLTAPAQ